MALINCPECGHEISDQSTVCIHCGYTIKKKNKFPFSRASIKKPRDLIIMVVVILVIVLGLFFFFNAPSPQEKYVIDCVQDFKSHLKDPFSLVLHEDVMVIDAGKINDKTLEGIDGQYCFISYGAANSFGAMDRDLVIYRDGLFIGTRSDKDELFEKIENLDDEQMEQYGELVTAELVLSYRNFIVAGTGSEPNGCAMINKDKVLQRIK